MLEDKSCRPSIVNDGEDEDSNNYGVNVSMSTVNLCYTVLLPSTNITF